MHNVDSDRVRAIANFLAEGHTYTEAAKEYEHKREHIAEWIGAMNDDELQEKALKGEAFARKYWYVRRLTPYALYMAQIHTEEETKTKFGISEEEINGALEALAKVPRYQGIVMMAHAGARRAAKKRR